jgi:hypothetical protein
VSEVWGKVLRSKRTMRTKKPVPFKKHSQIKVRKKRDKRDKSYSSFSNAGLRTIRVYYFYRFGLERKRLSLGKNLCLSPKVLWPLDGQGAGSVVERDPIGMGKLCTAEVPSANVAVDESGIVGNPKRRRGAAVSLSLANAGCPLQALFQILFKDAPIVTASPPSRQRQAKSVR